MAMLYAYVDRQASLKTWSNCTRGWWELKKNILCSLLKLVNCLLFVFPWAHRQVLRLYIGKVLIKCHFNSYFINCFTIKGSFLEMSHLRGATEKILSLPSPYEHCKLNRKPTLDNFVHTKHTCMFSTVSKINRQINAIVQVLRWSSKNTKFQKGNFVLNMNQIRDPT